MISQVVKYIGSNTGTRKINNLMNAKNSALRFTIYLHIL